MLDWLGSCSFDPGGVETSVRDKTSHHSLYLNQSLSAYRDKIVPRDSSLKMLSSRSTASLAAAILLSFVVWLVSFSLKWRRQRAKYKDLPCPPHDFWWGHLKVLGMAQKEMPPGFHYQ